MKLFVLASLFLLLCVGSAEATICAGDTTKECWTKGQHTITYTQPTGEQDYLLVPIPKGERNGLDGLTLIKTEQLDCPAKMEAAMRAYDKFVNYGLMPGKAEDIPERAPAVALWDETKRDCWKGGNDPTKHTR